MGEIVVVPPSKAPYIQAIQGMWGYSPGSVICRAQAVLTQGAENAMTIGCRRALLAGILGAGVFTAACHEDGGTASKFGDGELAGAWHRSVVVTADNCGTETLGQPSESLLQVSHRDSTLTINYYNTCGTLVSADQPGLLTGSAVTVTRNLGHVCHGDPFVVMCCYDVVETDTGTFLGVGIAGETVEVFSLNTSLSHASCDPSFSCTIRGASEWLPCPPGDCSFQSCATATSSSP